MAQLPKGATFSIATAFAAAVAVNDISNASPPVVTTAAVHGLTTGDIVELGSGWTKFNRRTFKVLVLTTTTFSLVDQDATNTGLYPPGSSAGTVKKVSTWTQVPKVMNPQTSGGDPKNVAYEFVEDENEYQINNGFAATSYTMEIDDDITTPGYAAMLKATEEQTDTILRILMKGAKNPTYLPCNAAMNPMPVLQEGSINRLKLAFNGRARPTRYTGVVA